MAKGYSIEDFNAPTTATPELPQADVEYSIEDFSAPAGYSVEDFSATVVEPPDAPATVADTSTQYTAADFNQQPPTAGTGAHLEQTIIEQDPLFKAAVYVGSGEFLRGPPSRLTGQTRAMRTLSSTRGAPPGSDEMPGQTWASGGWQFGLNLLAGAAGLVGAKFTFPLMAGMAATREATEGAARLAAISKHGDVPISENVFGQEGGYSSQAAIQRALSTGNLSAAAHRARLHKRAEAGIRMTLESLSLPIAAAVHAAPGDREAAAWDAFYTYPIESLLGPAAILKGSARAGIGGKAKPLPVKMDIGKPSVAAELSKVGVGKLLTEPLKSIREIRSIPGEERTFTKFRTDEPVVHELPPRKTIFGLKGPRDLELAPWAHKMFYRTPDWLKPVIWDTMTPADQLTTTRLREFQRLSSTEHVRDAANHMFDGAKWETFKKTIREKANLEIARRAKKDGAELPPLTDQQLDVLTFDAIQGILFTDKKTGTVTFSFDQATKKANEHAVQWAREARSVIPGTLEDYKMLLRVGKTLERAGLDRERVGLVTSYLMRMVPDSVAHDTPTRLGGIPLEIIKVVEGERGVVRELTAAGEAIATRRRGARSLLSDREARSLAFQEQVVDRWLKGSHLEQRFGLGLADAFDGGYIHAYLDDYIIAASGGDPRNRLTDPSGGMHYWDWEPRPGAEDLPRIFGPEDSLGPKSPGAVQFKREMLEILGKWDQENPVGLAGAKYPGRKAAAGQYIGAAREGLLGEDATRKTPKQKKYYKEIDKKLKRIGDGGAQFASPSDLYRHFANNLDDMLKEPGGAKLVRTALDNLTNKMGNDQEWIKYVNTPKSVNGHTWIPSDPFVGAGKAAAIEQAAPGLRAYAALQELEAGGGPRTYGIPITQKGRLVRDVGENKYQQTLNRIAKDFAGDDAQRRMDLVTALYNSRPILRLRAGPEENVLVNFLSEQMINPESQLYKLGTLFQAQQQELPRLLGIDPVVIMNKSNTYVTRAWNDLTENQMRIQRELDNDIFGLPLHKTSPRHKRRQSHIESQKRYMEMHMDDPTGFTAETVVKFSIDQTQQLLENLHYFDELHTWLDEQGIDMSKPRKGFEQVPTLRDVEPQAKAHANDPFNWMFGKMAGKYVPSQLAKSMKLGRDAYAKSPPIISYWKLVHTAFNLPGYQVRNELGDLLNVAAASGYNPTSKAWRRTRTRAYKEMTDYYDKNVTSADIQSAVSRGVMMDKSATTAPMVTGDAVSVAAARVNEVGTQVMERTAPGLDPTSRSTYQTVKTLNNLMSFGDFARGSWRKWGVSVFGKKGEKLGTAWDNAVKAWQDAKARQVGGGHLLAHGENMVRQLNKELSEGVIVRWTVRQENRRRLFAYKMAKKMGLDDAGAAKWALDTLHDYGDRPGWLKTIQTAGPIPYVTPPFSTYFYKQSVFQMRQALNSPELFASWMLLNGMDAYDEQYRHDQDKIIAGKPMAGTQYQSEIDFLSRLQFANYASYGAAHKVLGSGRGVANALQDLGWKGGEGTVVNAIEGWDERGNLHQLTYTLPLRDIANLSNMLMDFQPNETVEKRLSRLSPFTDLLFVFSNPETLRSPATGEMVHPSDPAMSQKAYRSLQQLVHTFTPWQSWDRYGPASILTGRTKDALVSASRGKLYTVGRSGYPIDPVSALTRTITPGLGISAISQVNIWRRVKNKYDAQKRALTTKHNKYKYRLTPFREEDRIVESRAQAMFNIHMQLNGLQMAYAIGDKTKAELRKDRRELAANWKEIENDLKRGDNPLESDLGTPTSQIVMQSLMDAVSWVYEGKEGEEATE